LADRKRVFILGLDALEPDYIKRWKDELPNLTKLGEEGCHDLLESTLPYNSPVAWTSFFTGMNAGKHGIFNWGHWREEASSFEPYSYNDIRARTLMEYLSDNNVSCSVLGFPMCYPSRSLEKVVWVCGLFHPESAGISELVSPPGIMNELKENGIELELSRPSQELMKQNMDEYLRQNIGINNRRVDAALHLYENHDIKVTLVLYDVTDHVNHVSQDWDQVKAVYKEADSQLGKVLERLRNDTILMVMSDHGSLKYRNRIAANKLLLEKGHITVRGPDAGDLEQISARIKRKYPYLHPFWKLAPRFLKEHVAKRNRKLKFDHIEEFRALNFYLHNQVYLLDDSLTGRVKEELMSLPGIKEVRTREELYSGPFVSEAPHLLCVTEDERDYLRPFPILGKGPGSYVTEDHSFGGGHRLHGVLYSNLQGDEFREEKRLMDLCPTILSLMGIPVPEEMDGRSLLRSAPEMRKKYDEGYIYPQREATKLSSEEFYYLEEQLKGMGYL